jgi:hypothetical protein
LAILISFLLFSPSVTIASESQSMEVGIGSRDVTPDVPIWLAGYAARTRPADKVDHRLRVQAMALRNPNGDRFVLVSLDNCEVNGLFMQPVLQQFESRFQLPRGTVAVVSSHTHSAPVLEGPLQAMMPDSAADREAISKYSRLLQDRLVEAVGAALEDLKPSTIEHGVGRATFAMNRRVYQGDRVVFGDNPDGPVDWQVPVLRVKGMDGATRAILFGYACHGTSIRSGADWYVVSGDYMAYAREHLERHQPAATAMYLTGMGADSDPSPRGSLLDAQRHGLELAGAVMGVLNRPMRPVDGPFKWAYEEVELPFVDSPSRHQLETDARSSDRYVRHRAESFLKRLNEGQPLPQSVKLPVAALRIGDDLTFVLMGGEVVVDYAKRLQRLLAADHLWAIGYAYDVPCYIPSVRLIKEGGYEPDYSLVYYGFYGPFRTAIEDILVTRATDMVTRLR